MTFLRTAAGLGMGMELGLGLGIRPQCLVYAVHQGALPSRGADAQFPGLAPELRHASLLKGTPCDRHSSVGWAAGAGRLYVI